MSIITVNVNHDFGKIDEIIYLVKNIGEKMVTQADIDNVVNTLEKVRVEVINARDALLAQIAQLESQSVDVTALQVIAQQLDDLNPDTPV